MLVTRLGVTWPCLPRDRKWREKSRGLVRCQHPCCWHTIVLSSSLSAATCVSCSAGFHLRQHNRLEGHSI